MEETVRPLAICSQGTFERGERLAECSRDTLHGCRAVHDGRRGRRATLEERRPSPQCFSSEATGTNKSIVMSDPKSPFRPLLFHDTLFKSAAGLVEIAVDTLEVVPDRSCSCVKLFKCGDELAVLTKKIRISAETLS